MRNYMDEAARVVLADIRELEFAWNDSRAVLELVQDRPATDNLRDSGACARSSVG